MDDVGKLNREILIRQYAREGVDAAGQPVIKVFEIGPIFAGVEFRPVGSDEQVIGKQNTAVTAVRFTIRYSPERTVEAADTVVYDGKLYEIDSVLEADANRKYLLLETKQMGETKTA